MATALAWNNYDVNTEMLSGRGTVHDTVGICSQNLPTSVFDQEKDGIDIVDPVHQKQKKKKLTSKGVHQRIERVGTLQKEAHNSHI